MHFNFYYNKLEVSRSPEIFYGSMPTSFSRKSLIPMEKTYIP